MDGEFVSMTLADLNVMLTDMLKNVEVGDTAFIRRLCDAIHERTTAEAESKRLRTVEDNIAFWRSDEAMDCD